MLPKVSHVEALLMFYTLRRDSDFVGVTMQFRQFGEAGHRNIRIGKLP